MKAAKTWLKTRLRQALGLPDIEEVIQKLSVDSYKLNEALTETRQTLTTALAETRQHLTARVEDLELFGVSPWYTENLWEPPVQIALRDLCKPGDVVFDVGANFGGLTTVMSRMVGPQGKVCSFEASPRIVGKCQRNVIMNGCNNVQIYHVAVYHTSHHQVPIYLGSHLNDSIYSSNTTEQAAYNIETLALDDFVQFTGLLPNLVKMDIEGAEFDALVGMVQTIAKAKPFLILETQPEDTRCLDFLREKGYIAIDLSTYREIQSPADYPPGAQIRNNLYVHQDRLSEVLYQPPFQFQEVLHLQSQDFVKQEHSYVLQQPLKLDQGRYLIDLDFAAEGTQNEMMCGVKANGQVIFRYHAYTKLLADSYRDWIIHLDRPSSVELYFDFLNSTNDETFAIRGAKLSQIAQFAQSPSQLYQ